VYIYTKYTFYIRFYVYSINEEKIMCMYYAFRNFGLLHFSVDVTWKTYIWSEFIICVQFAMSTLFAIFVYNLTKYSLLKFTLCPHAVIYTDNILLLALSVCQL